MKPELVYLKIIGQVNNMKCLNCEYCVFGKDNDGASNAKCMKTSKKGKTITWALQL